MEVFTIVGVYKENLQIYVTSAEASDAFEAAEIARAEAPDDIYVASVFAGDHQDLYGKDEMIIG